MLEQSYFDNILDIVVGSDDEKKLMKFLAENVRLSSRYDFCVSCWAFIHYKKSPMHKVHLEYILKPKEIEPGKWLRVVGENGKFLDEGKTLYTRPRAEVRKALIHRSDVGDYSYDNDFERGVKKANRRRVIDSSEDVAVKVRTVEGGRKYKFVSKEKMEKLEEEVNAENCVDDSSLNSDADGCPKEADDEDSLNDRGINICDNVDKSGLAEGLLNKLGHNNPLGQLTCGNLKSELVDDVSACEKTGLNSVSLNMIENITKGYIRDLLNSQFDDINKRIDDNFSKLSSALMRKITGYETEDEDIRLGSERPLKLGNAGFVLEKITLENGRSRSKYDIRESRSMLKLPFIKNKKTYSEMRFGKKN